jgi:hypothetical protein
MHFVSRSIDYQWRLRDQNWMAGADVNAQINLAMAKFRVRISTGR